MMNLRFLAAVPLVLASQFALGQAPASDWEAELRQFDTEYWQAFNQCDVAKLTSLNATDLEFYHDVGGPTHGLAAFSSAFKNNICGNLDRRVRREAVPGSIRIFPMRDKGVIYGAVMSGEHIFINTEKGVQQPSGRALFTHMLLRENGGWKVSRVLSFDHGPAK